MRGLVGLLAAGPLLLHRRERHPGAGDGIAFAAGRAAILVDVSSATMERAVSLAR